MVSHRLSNRTLRAAAIFGACLLTGGVQSSAQNLSGVTIGSDRTALMMLGSEPIATQTLGPHTIIKYRLPGGNEFSATFLRSSGRIVFLETDWGRQLAGTFADFEGFKYGETTLEGIREHFASNGFAYEMRAPVFQQDDGSVAFLNSYEIEGSSVIVTFVTEVSASSVAQLKAEPANGAASTKIASEAKLVSLLLAANEYADTIWGADKTYDDGYSPISWSGGQNLAPSARKELTVAFNERGYPVSKIYSGKVQLPDFNGRDKDFRNFRTRIRNGMKEGANFAGEMSLVQIGCGTGCSFVLVGNVRTGQVYSFPRGGEEAMYLSLKASLNSSMLIAQWASYEENKCFVEYFHFDGTVWDVLGKRQVGDVETCYNTIDENIH